MAMLQYVWNNSRYMLMNILVHSIILNYWIENMRFCEYEGCYVNFENKNKLLLINKGY